MAGVERSRLRGTVPLLTQILHNSTSVMMLAYHHAQCQDARFQTPAEPKKNNDPCPERPHASHAQHELVHDSSSNCNQLQKRRLCLPYFPQLSQSVMSVLDTYIQKTERPSPKRCADEPPMINLSPRRSTPEPPTAVGPVPSVTPSSTNTDMEVQKKCSKRRRRSTLMDESIRLERRSCFSRAA